mmetsp:Transcript_175/g.374  ORF Transcript_175/g.374 Transcript_175/m.374 type:complete len:228 (-) Transcript_175:303-986(-)
MDHVSASAAISAPARFGGPPPPPGPPAATPAVMSGGRKRRRSAALMPACASGRAPDCQPRCATKAVGESSVSRRMSQGDAGGARRRCACSVAKPSMGWRTHERHLACVCSDAGLRTAAARIEPAARRPTTTCVASELTPWRPSAGPYQPWTGTTPRVCAAARASMRRRRSTAARASPPWWREWQTHTRPPAPLPSASPACSSPSSSSSCTRVTACDSPAERTCRGRH